MRRKVLVNPMADLNSLRVPRLVLASGSRFRQALMANAGLEFDVHPADVDEPALRDTLEKSTPRPDAKSMAAALALAKARLVSAHRPGQRILGCDQILALPPDGAHVAERIFAKPADLTEATAHIRLLAGRTHHLHSAAVLVRDGDIEWQTVATASLTMRPLESSEIARYIDRAGPGICDTVGAYMLEGLGIHLFERIEGDYFTIIGLPMLEVLAGLRRLGQTTL